MTEILFTGNWEEIVSGKLQKGGSFSINYDSNRLPRGRATYNGMPAWNISAYVRFSENDTIQCITLKQSMGTMMTAQVVIPKYAEKIIIWFSNGDRAGVHDYDSNYEANYHFNLTE